MVCNFAAFATQIGGAVGRALALSTKKAFSVAACLWCMVGVIQWFWFFFGGILDPNWPLPAIMCWTCWSSEWSECYRSKLQHLSVCVSSMSMSMSILGIIAKVLGKQVREDPRSASTWCLQTSKGKRILAEMVAISHAQECVPWLRSFSRVRVVKVLVPVPVLSANHEHSWPRRFKRRHEIIAKWQNQEGMCSDDDRM